MRSYKPLSTISYNTPTYLQLKLETLLDQGHISFWAFIKHYGENGKKDHFHVYIEPIEELDTQSKWFREWFKEKVNNPPCDKPLNVERWQKSKFDDWVLYGQHDSKYLAKKGLVKEYTDYGINCFCTSDSEEFDSREKSINRTAFLPPVTRMLNCCREGLNVVEAMQALRIPFGAMGSFIKAWNLVEALVTEEDVKQIAGYDYVTGELDPNFDPNPVIAGKHVDYLRDTDIDFIKKEKKTK